MSRLRFLTPVLVVAVASQLLMSAIVARRWYRSWGTTRTEYREALPGDAVVDSPNIAQTHAVTIAAAPEDVWPWIVQLGTSRGGWYSYDCIENAMGLGVRSADTIIPELQQLHVGDTVPLAPDVALPVVRLEPPRLLLLSARDSFIGDCSWLFLLRSTDAGDTRLITRFRVRWTARGPMKALLTFIEPGSFLMERKMLLGIKARAERLAQEHTPVAAAAALG